MIGAKSFAAVAEPSGDMHMICEHYGHSELSKLPQSHNEHSERLHGTQWKRSKAQHSRELVKSKNKHKMRQMILARSLEINIATVRSAATRTINLTMWYSYWTFAIPANQAVNCILPWLFCYLFNYLLIYELIYLHTYLLINFSYFFMFSFIHILLTQTIDCVVWVALVPRVYFWLRVLSPFYYHTAPQLDRMDALVAAAMQQQYPMHQQYHHHHQSLIHHQPQHLMRLETSETSSQSVSSPVSSEVVATDAPYHGVGIASAHDNICANQSQTQMPSQATLSFENTVAASFSNVPNTQTIPALGSSLPIPSHVSASVNPLGVRQALAHRDTSPSSAPLMPHSPHVPPLLLNLDAMSAPLIPPQHAISSAQAAHAFSPPALSFDQIFYYTSLVKQLMAMNIQSTEESSVSSISAARNNVAPADVQLQHLPVSTSASLSPTASP